MRSDATGDFEALPVLAGEEDVALAGIGEAFGLGVHLEVGTEDGGSGGEIDAIGDQVIGEALERFGGGGVVTEPFADGFGPEFFAEQITDIAGVTEGAGKVAFLDVGGEVGGFPAADGGDEIGVVIRALLPSTDFLPLPVIGDGGIVGRNGDVSAFAVDDDTDLCALVIGHVFAPGVVLELA